jgi:RNA recognition motif-containing protein
METKLYVANIAPHTIGEDLRMLFSRTGQVTAVDVVKDRTTGKARGFAFVTMASEAEAGKAISEFDGYTLDNRRLKVHIALGNTRKGGENGSRSRRKQSQPFQEYKSYNESIRKSPRPGKPH